MQYLNIRVSRRVLCRRCEESIIRDDEWIIGNNKIEHTMVARAFVRKSTVKLGVDQRIEIAVLYIRLTLERKIISMIYGSVE